MITTTYLNQDQREALQEVTNIAMGQAGSSLSQLLGVFVKLSIPQINIIEFEEINQALTMLVGASKEVSVVRQAFSGDISGEAVAIFEQAGCAELAELMGYDEVLSSHAEQELMIDVANILIGACVRGVTNLLNTNIAFAAPSFMARNASISNLIRPSTVQWKLALVTEVNFALEKGHFTCHLTQFWPDSSLEKLSISLDKFIESF
jgi:chemotaxis protein CheC